jgi:hypothetical protein
MTTTVTSARAHCIQPSVTLELAARAKALMAAGEPVINLSAGEPDMPTPAPIVEAAHRALDAGGHFTYTATPGVLPLRKALAQTYTERLGLPLTPQHFVVSNGAKQALYNALATATDPGQRIGVLRPYWVTYVEQARALGTEPVVIDCPAATGFRPDLDALQTELRRGLRVLIVNSPGQSHRCGVRTRGLVGDPRPRRGDRHPARERRDLRGHRLRSARPRQSTARASGSRGADLRGVRFLEGLCHDRLAGRVSRSHRPRGRPRWMPCRVT